MLSWGLVGMMVTGDRTVSRQEWSSRLRGSLSDTLL